MTQIGYVWYKLGHIDMQCTCNVGEDYQICDELRTLHNEDILVQIAFLCAFKCMTVTFKLIFTAKSSRL